MRDPVTMTGQPSPDEVVRAFLAAIEARDLDGAAGLLAEDVVYDNVPIGAVTGRDGAREVLRRPIEGADEVRWEVSHQVAAGDVVMNERVDRFRIGEAWVEIPVAGVFVVRDGLIQVWRDYFDLETYRRQQS